MNIFEKPYTEEEIRTKANNNRIEGVIKIEMAQIIHSDMEEFLDIISEKLTGSCLLSDISYKIVGYESDYTILLLVSGDISEIFWK